MKPFQYQLEAEISRHHAAAFSAQAALAHSQGNFKNERTYLGLAADSRKTADEWERLAAGRDEN